MNEGKTSQIIGPVVDVEFDEKLPEIFHALKIGDAAIVIPVTASYPLVTVLLAISIPDFFNYIYYFFKKL